MNTSNNLFKKLILILLLSILLFSLTGCYDAKGVETLSYVVAIGLDVGENNLLKLTLQLATTGESGGGPSLYTDTTITSVECTSINSGFNLINSYISKQIYLAHCKIIVISEELAAEGISEYISTFANNIEIRPDCNILISRCDASDFLNASSPGLETLVAKHYDLVFNSITYTGFSSDATLFSVFSALEDEYCHPTAILSGITSSEQGQSTSTSNFVDLDGNYKAGNTPVDSQNELENMGLAVFYEDNLVGELTGIETVCHLMFTNSFHHTVLSIPNPFVENGFIDLSLLKKDNMSKEVKLINGSPYIKGKVSLIGNIVSMDIGLDFSSSENIEILEEYASNYLKEHLLNYLYKTSKDFGTDIVGFGRILLKKYWTFEEWEKIDWLKLYKDSFFDVEIDLDIKNSNLLLKN